MAATVRSNQPAIVPLANAIRAVTTQPLEQLVMVNDITHLLVDYDDDERVYGAPEYHATFEEMLARRRQAGWVYLRDDCDGRAVFAAHLLAALGIEWRLEASFWKEHAWIVARVNGVDFDLLDLRKDSPEAARISYKLFGHLFVHPSHRPPPFAWRRAWAERTSRNVTIGRLFGLLTLDSTPSHMRERYATDWTVRVPASRLSPIDDRFLAATIAGFPFGEPLQVGALAKHPVPSAKAPKAAPAALAGVSTGASTAADVHSDTKKPGAE
ncbi:MAG: hypothetical protein Q7S40_19200 [Opitutaceae bacterium]|nr:hypothetical protein [Opitutaceae bacterium]